MKPLALILFLALSTQLFAQTDYLHINRAYEQSTTESKPIMLVFSGSDWCKPCIQLKKDILESPEFTEISDQVIFMYLDFPYKKANRLSKAETKHNEQLAEQYNKEGHFPRVLFINNKGELLQEVLYEKGKPTETFIANIKKIIDNYENNNG